jgi:hypothetical protein
MHEVFYYNREHLNIVQIIKVCAKHNLLCYQTSDYLQVYSTPDNDYDEYCKLYDIGDMDGIVYSDENIAILEQYQPKTHLMLSFRYHNFPFTVQVLKAVMTEHGGWAGCDDEWEKRYDVHNVHEMWCFG